MANRVQHHRITLIDIIYLTICIGTGVTFATKLMPITGIVIAISIGVIAFFIPVLIFELFFGLLGMLDNLLLFRQFPSKCEHCKSELFLDGKSEVIATQEMANLQGVIVNLLLIRCKCGKMYFSGDSVLLRVHEDGSLIPYVKRTKWRGWRKDIRLVDNIMCQDFTEENRLKIQDRLNCIRLGDSQDQWP